VRNKRHDQEKEYLENEEDKQRKRKITTIAKKFWERGSRNSKVTVIQNQMYTPFKVEVQPFSNWQELK